MFLVAIFFSILIAILHILFKKIIFFII
jgi:hypothetical protein